MKLISNNPILTFRIELKPKYPNGDIGSYLSKEGIHTNSFKLIEKDTLYTATLITRSREAVDMSETSYL